MGSFYGWGSTASSLELLQGGSLLFTIKFPEIPGNCFINFGMMKGDEFLNTGTLDWEFTAREDS